MNDVETVQQQRVLGMNMRCWLWGHVDLWFDEGEWLAAVRCNRCPEVLEIVGHCEMLPERFQRRGEGWRTIGPVRSLTEYLSCQLFGHDAEWVRQWNVGLDVETCRTCGQRFRARSDRELREASHAS